MAPTLFISSVIHGYEAYRDTVDKVARDLGYTVVRAEQFRARVDSPEEACLREVRDSDVVVLLLGDKPGYMISEGLSATRAEYLQARERGKPILAFDERVAREPGSFQEKFVNEVRAWASGRFTAPFTNVDDLRSAVTDALQRMETSRAAELRQYLARSPEPPSLPLLPPVVKTFNEWVQPIRAKRRELPGASETARAFTLSLQGLAGHSRVVILGDAGSGKTWALHEFWREAAGAARRELDDQETTAPSSPIPLYVRLPRLARALEQRLADALKDPSLVDETTVEPRLTATIITELAAPGDGLANLRPWLCGRLLAGECLLLLDAQNDVALESRKAVAAALLALELDLDAQPKPGQIVITTRRGAYSNRLLRSPEVFELTGFQGSDWMGLARKVLGDKFDAFRQEVDEDPRGDLQNLLRLPLTAGLLLGVATRGPRSLPRSRTGVLERIIEHLLEEAWRDPLSPRAPPSREQIEIRRQALWRLASAFVDPHGSLRGELDSSEAIGALGGSAISLDDLARHAALLVMDESQSGAAIAGRLRFVHDMFREFLIAQSLAERTDWHDRVRPHYRDDTWTGVIELLAGSLGNRSSSLIEDIVSQGDVRTGHEAERLVCLGARCLGEVPREVRIDEQLVDRIAASLFEVARRPHLVNDPHAVVEALEKSGGRFISALLDATHDEVWWVRPIAAHALARLGSEALPPVIDVLRSNDPLIRAYAAEAIGLIGDSRGVAGLVGLLTDHDVRVFKASVRALATIGDDESIRALVGSLGDGRPYARAFVAVELGESRARGVRMPEDMLLSLLASGDLSSGHGAAMALGRIGDANSMPGLVAVLTHGDRNIRLYAAYAIDVILHRLGKNIAVHEFTRWAGAVAAWFGGRLAAEATREQEHAKVSTATLAAIAAHVKASYPEDAVGVLLGATNEEGITASLAWGPATKLELAPSMTVRGYYRSFGDQPAAPGYVNFRPPDSTWLLVNCFLGTGVSFSAFVAGKDPEDWRAVPLMSS